MTISWPRTTGGLLAIAILLALVVGAACGDDDDGSGSSPTPTVTATATPTATATETPTSTSFSTDDPFAYCAEVGTIDSPDERYTGEAVPQVIAEGIRDATGGSPDAPLDFFTRGTSWRCLDGDVYACTVGANLPCEAKADTSKTPNPAMTEYCQQNPDSDFIPAAVTGRSTVYEWVCNGEEAVASRQVMQVDERGFIADIWYRLEPPDDAS